jgi:hypothetical protein
MLTIAMLEDMFKGMPKDTPVFVAVMNGFMVGCEAESGEAEIKQGEKVFIIMPCTCNEEPQDFNLHAEDFEDPSKN